MLSGKAFTGGKGYVEHHLKSNDYYEKGKTVTGHWLGKACREFGVHEGMTVTDKEFEALRNNMNPITEKQLTLRNNTTRIKTVSLKNEIVSKEVVNRRSFYDFTVSSPKSFSVMAVTLGDNRIREWHDRAVKKAINGCYSFFLSLARLNLFCKITVYNLIFSNFRISFCSISGLDIFAFTTISPINCSDLVIDFNLLIIISNDHLLSSPTPSLSNKGFILCKKCHCR